jgi:hypothetical protein
MFFYINQDYTLIIHIIFSVINRLHDCIIFNFELVTKFILLLYLITFKKIVILFMFIVFININYSF